MLRLSWESVADIARGDCLVYDLGFFEKTLSEEAYGQVGRTGAH
jgi:hypothetical protein